MRLSLGQKTKSQVGLEIRLALRPQPIFPPKSRSFSSDEVLGGKLWELRASARWRFAPNCGPKPGSSLLFNWGANSWGPEQEIGVQSRARGLKKLETKGALEKTQTPQVSPSDWSLCLQIGGEVRVQAGDLPGGGGRVSVARGLPALSGVRSCIHTGALLGHGLHHVQEEPFLRLLLSPLSEPSLHLLEESRERSVVGAVGNLTGSPSRS